MTERSKSMSRKTYSFLFKVSDNEINKIFRKMFGLKIAVSSIAGFRDQVAREAKPLYEKIKEQLK
ncbi:MAG: hypothetical protein WCV56_07320, partial [Candidatus Omnitrophota bacterium]